MTDITESSAGATHPLDRLRAAISASYRWFQETETDGIIIGGVAAALLGDPRGTDDVDWTASIDEDKIEAFISAGKKFDIFSLISDPVEFSHRSNLIPFIHRPSTIKIDVAFAWAPFEVGAIHSKRRVSLFGLELPLPKTEDLIVMKAVARRPIDVADLEKLLVFNPSVDVKYIRRWVKEYAKIMESPEVVADLDRMIKRREAMFPSKKPARKKRR